MRAALSVFLLAALCCLCGVATAADKAPDAATAAEKPLRIGFLYSSPVGNAGWSHAHDLARRELARDPANITSFVEAVSDAERAEAVIRDMSEQGTDLIITTSILFMDPTIAVAADFPKLTYMHCAGYKTAENVGNYFGRMYQARYLSGMAAGSMTKSNIIGYVAAYPIPEVIRGMNAFTLGAREANPKAEVRVIWTNTWFDPVKEKESAKRLIRDGADVIAQHQDSSAPQEAAREESVYSVGYSTDMSSFAPESHLVAAIWTWAPYYRSILARMRDGTWTSGSVWAGMDTGIVDISPFGPMVPEDVRQKIEARRQQIIKGSYVVFKGPVIDRDGRVRIIRGKVPSDKELLEMDWYVQGVVERK